ncbi:unnamed protein product [Durusdinium trenchii]|uniref:Uncharacterized protein n=1 Tax=Durusdinium trenchii TaxID=1381693 RepID=A0ABP0P9N1_9DINO
MSQRGLWGWVHEVGKSCGFAPQSQTTPMWVRAQPDLFPNEVPGMSEELLQRVSSPGGSLEEKLEEVINVFQSGARHLESLQQVLRRRALEKRQKDCKELPPEVEEVIAEGTYLESFLEAFDGQSFLLHSEEIAPSHEYRLALEVNSGGAYWKSIPVEEGAAVRHNVETVTASSPAEGSMSIISQFGAAQRGAVFVWRWQHILDAGPYKLPDWLEKALTLEGHDPLRKLQTELEAVLRWEHQVQLETCKYVKQNNEIKDMYIREVLRLWPSEIDHQGVEACKKCAWVEGLDANLFTGRNVLVKKVPYDADHTYVLHCNIARRQVGDADKEQQGPPYRLTTSWQWFQDSTEKAEPSFNGVQSISLAAVPETASPGAGASRPDISRTSVPVMESCSEMRPSTAGALLPSMTPYSELPRPGSANSVPGVAYATFGLPTGQSGYPSLAGGYPYAVAAAKSMPYPASSRMQMRSGPMPLPTPMAGHVSPGVAASPTLAFPCAATPVGTR